MPIVINHRDSNERCCRCARASLWGMRKLGKTNGRLNAKRFYCGIHFDKLLEDNWDALSEYEIERLSDNEGDFDRYLKTGATHDSDPICQVPKSRHPALAAREEA